MKRMTPSILAAALLAVAVTALPSHAKGKHGAAGPGTGSKTESTAIHGYVKKDGTTVQSHQRSKADKEFENNWSTKGNQNPTTGKEGTVVTKPQQP